MKLNYNKTIEDYPYTYIWDDEWDEMKGCEKCILSILKKTDKCPVECDKISGCYRMMTFSEMNSKKMLDRIKDKPICKRENK